jgi:hypothetical protein
MDVGAALRDARERRGLTLRRLADVTKISQTILRAIEENRIADLPPEVYARGFVRAYAREVGMDPAEIVERYVSQFADRTPAVAPPPPPAEGGPPPLTEPGGAERFRLVAIGMAVLLAAVAASFLLADRPSPSERPASEAAADQSDVAGESDAGEPVPREAATSGSVEQPVPDEDAPLRVGIESQGPCWIEATADGVQILYRLLPSGERESIEAQDELVLRVGDPAAIALEINGAPGRVLGSAGRPVTVRITPRNYREFLNR